jgi:predicted metal-dependent hydrolase
MEQRIKIHDLEIEYEVIHRDIRFPRLAFKIGKLQVILPKNYDNPRELIDRHRKWIYSTATVIHDALNKPSHRKLNLERTDEEFKELISVYVDVFSEKLGVYPNKIKFRSMKSRWGSCSSQKKNITINTHLQYLPDTIIGYVILHELIHLLEKGHTKVFWEMISKTYPDYKDIKKELLAYGYLLKDSGLLE